MRIRRRHLFRPQLEGLENRVVLDATLQIIHNSPYAAAKFVDVYVNGTKLLDDLEYTKATNFQSVPSNTPLTIDITPGSATDNKTPVFTTTVTLNDNKNYLAFAVGDPGTKVGPSAFKLALSDQGRKTALNPANVEFLVAHGSPDAPTVDVVARGVGTLVNDISYPNIDTKYLSVAPGVFTLDVTLADGTTQVASFKADLSGAKGQALTVAATGLLNPGAGDGKFGLLAVFADGTTALLPTVPGQAFLQVVHNSPYAAAKFVDVYVNGTKLLDDFEFRKATKFLALDAGVKTNIQITAGTAPNNSNPLVSVTNVFDLNKNYIAFAVGNPAVTSGPTALSLAVTAVGQTKAVNPANVEVLVAHGSPDAPTVDVLARNVGTLVNDITYPQINNKYLSIAPANYTLDVTLADGVTPVGSFKADLSAAKGAALSVAASGLVNPGVGDGAFGLLAVFADGNTAVLPAAPAQAKLQVVHNSPYAAAKVVDVYVNGVKLLDDFVFRSASPFVTVDTNVPVTIDVTAGTATSNAKPLFTTTTTFAAGKNYLAFAQGNPAVSTGPTAFTLGVSALGQLSATKAGNVEFLVYHGSPDAPTVDINARLVGPLVNDISFGSFASSYTSVPPAAYTIDVTLADGVTRVNSFRADLSAAKGAALTVSASGLLAPAAGDGAFGLLAVFADGKTAFLPAAPAFAEQTYATGALNASGPVVQRFTLDGKATAGLNPFPGSPSAPRVATGDVTGDGVADFVAANGPGGPATVNIYDGRTNELVRTLTAFPDFTGGVFVSLGDFNNDGRADLVLSPDEGGGPRVRVLSGKDDTTLADFFGIDDQAFRGGARVSVGDLNGDRIPDLLVGAGFGGGPRVALFDGSQLAVGSTPPKLVGDFFVFEPGLRNGVFLTAGDLNSDGQADLIFGAGPGGGPRVFAFSAKEFLATAGSTRSQLANFFAGNVDDRGGVNVAAKDLDGDYRVELIAAPGANSTGTTSTVYAGKDVPSDRVPPTFRTITSDGLLSAGVFVG